MTSLYRMGGLRYFEKENGGVSTALNLGIKNMRGKYFSWLSHDDIYLPEKIQVEIDALRQAGDMSRVVHSNFFYLKMPERIVDECKTNNYFRQEFLETGAVAPLCWFISGCTLLIPKFYFDVYGGFDETFRAVQDYKKWFEMFRGKRLIYVRKPLVLSRQHAEQTTHTYSIRISEGQWLFSWMTYNLHKDDIVGSGLTDMYHSYSALFTKWQRSYTHQQAMPLVIQKLTELSESPDAEARAKKLSNLINDGNFETYLPKEQEGIIKFDFGLRGVNLGGNVKFIPFNQFANVKPAQNVRLLHRDLLMQVLIDTPIRKAPFTEWLRSQGGQRA
ncbi:MAG: glycosyltransferase [Selenomonadaceae bacterium]|nr:glycosyltransferase [Selenomonadaceae bacterium]